MACHSKTFSILYRSLTWSLWRTDYSLARDGLVGISGLDLYWEAGWCEVAPSGAECSWAHCRMSQPMTTASWEVIFVLSFLKLGYCRSVQLSLQRLVPPIQVTTSQKKPLNFLNSWIIYNQTGALIPTPRTLEQRKNWTQFECAWDPKAPCECPHQELRVSINIL